MRGLGIASAALVLAASSLLPSIAGGADSASPDAALQPRMSLESVAISRPEDVERLEQLGVDVTHDVTATSATVALYSDAERELLDAKGFDSQTLIEDLAAKSAAEREAEADAEADAVPSALPSGRDTYRVYDDYLNDLNQLAENNPDFVRKFTIGQSIEGRDIIGIEIASEVHRTDDGRPAYVQMGLHHVREWPSGEFPMEFAIDLVNGYNADDPRISAIVENTRTFVIPVINPDGFLVSRGAATLDSGGGGVEGFGIVAGSGEYKRKNCRPANAAQAAMPCAQRPANSGIDLNRNYGYYWGGPGASTGQTAENYRGAAPFSEPEAEAVHQFVSRIHPTVLITNHTFTENGWWLRQPGFNGSFFPQEAPTYSPACLNPPNNPCAVVPDEPAMKALGDAMGDEGTDVPALGATGWPSDLGWELGDITGATEDWNYFAQGTYGYTPEARGSDFHGLYQGMVVAEYDGVNGGGGVREAFLLAADEARNTANHGIITGTAPPGATLTLHKEFDAPRHPSNGGPPTHEVLHSTLDGPAGGDYEWHVMPSDRPQIPLSPLPAGDEQWTMTCQLPAQDPFSQTVEVTRGGTTTVNWRGGACGTEPVTNLPPVANFDFSPAAPEVGEQITFTSTSTDPDGAIDPANIKWDLDDDGAFDDATGVIATHTFTNPGTFDVSVEVTDDDGASDPETKQITVSAPVNVPPIADFDFVPSSPRAGDDVTFTSTSTDADGDLTAFAWDLDDDGQFDDALGSEITRIFTVPGTYDISLQVTDNDSATDDVTKQVVISAAPGMAAPAAPAPQSCAGQTATIVGTLSADLLTGTPGNDVIAALDGSDQVRGLGGDDLICGALGEDSLAGGPGDDRVVGNKGDDRVRGNAGDDHLGGGLGDDVVSGGGGRDSCDGGIGRDRVRGCP